MLILTVSEGKVESNEKDERIEEREMRRMNKTVGGHKQKLWQIPKQSKEKFKTEKKNLTNEEQRKMTTTLIGCFNE
uniref:Uncharacterized protein n=1 Tax=Caenorhabditis japonica TaxID=281687 RepID=A0A8R1DM00_CAEJA